MRKPQALNRVKIQLTVTGAEAMLLGQRALESGVTIQAYIRRACGLKQRPAGGLSRLQRLAMADEAWDDLVRLGKNPRDLLPDHTPAVERAAIAAKIANETPAERAAINARVRQIVRDAG